MLKKMTMLSTTCDAAGCTETYEWDAENAWEGEEDISVCNDKALTKAGWGMVKHNPIGHVGNTVVLCPACFGKVMALLNAAVYGIEPRND